MFNPRSVLALLAAAAVVWTQAAAARPRITLSSCMLAPSVKPEELASLRTLELNRLINQGYGRFARCFQEIAEGLRPGAAPKGGAYPVWFAFAPYASRAVGASETALEALLAALPEAPTSLRDRLSTLLDPAKVARDIESFVKQLLVAFSGGAQGANLAALANPKVLATATTCVARAVVAVPKGGLAERARVLARTLLAMLEDGNRRIYGDIGGAGSRYLTWRRGRSGVEPSAVLAEFTPTIGGSADKARAVYAYATEHLLDSPRPADFGAALFRDRRASCRELKSAAFALWEAAGRDPGRRNALIAFGNNLLAYCEQAEVVQPAFAPPQAVAGEADRRELIRCMTPVVQLPVRAAGWSFYEYGRRRSVDVTAKNWGLFADRWPPILDSFETVYARPGAPWPMPNPDASKAP